MSCLWCLTFTNSAFYPITFRIKRSKTLIVLYLIIDILAFDFPDSLADVWKERKKIVNWIVKSESKHVIPLWWSVLKFKPRSNGLRWKKNERIFFSRLKKITEKYFSGFIGWSFKVLCLFQVLITIGNDLGQL